VLDRRPRGRCDRLFRGISPQWKARNESGLRRLPRGDRTRIELRAVQTRCSKICTDGQPVCSSIARQRRGHAVEAENLRRSCRRGSRAAGGTGMATSFRLQQSSGAAGGPSTVATEDAAFRDYAWPTHTVTFTGQPLFPVRPRPEYTRFRYDEARSATEIGIVTDSPEPEPSSTRANRTAMNCAGYAGASRPTIPTLPTPYALPVSNAWPCQGEQRCRVELAVPARTLPAGSAAQELRGRSGTYELQIGASSEDIRIPRPFGSKRAGLRQAT